MVGIGVGWNFFLPWLPLGLIVIFFTFAKNEPSAHRADFEAAGVDWETFPAAWVTSLEPYTNDIPWEPFVGPVPIFQWEDAASLSNYLATVHLWTFEWSTNCIEWNFGRELWCDDGLVPKIQHGLLNESIGTAEYKPDMLLWRAWREEE